MYFIVAGIPLAAFVSTPTAAAVSTVEKMQVPKLEQKSLLFTYLLVSNTIFANNNVDLYSDG